VPRQARSRERVERILDAAAVVFADAGFEPATTEEIARRAGVSIGSLYQFFPNKLALFEALAERTMERSQAAFDAVLSPELLERPWREVLRMVIDAFAAAREADPAFRAMLVNFQLYGVYAEADAAVHARFISRIETLIAAHATELAPARRKLVATMVVQVISAILFLSQRETPEFARKMVEETKTMLELYLAPLASAPAKKRAR
jgi:AcrR family transcriptional regulator